MVNSRPLRCRPWLLSDRPPLAPLTGSAWRLTIVRWYIQPAAFLASYAPRALRQAYLGGHNGAYGGVLAVYTHDSASAHVSIGNCSFASNFVSSSFTVCKHLKPAPSESKRTSPVPVVVLTIAMSTLATIRLHAHV